MQIKNNYLLIHGWGGTKKSLLKLENELNNYDETNSVHRIELPGFGETELNAEYTLDDYLGYVLKEMDSLTNNKDLQEIILVGHSVGGKIILRGLEKNAIKENTKLVLINASGIALPQNLKRRLVFFIAKLAAPIKFFLINLGFNNLFKVVQKFFYKFFVGARDYEKLNNKPLLRQTFKNIISDNINLAELEGVNNSILLIWGELDSATPLWMGERYKSILKNSHLEVIKDGKHGLPLFQPELTAKIINNYFKRITN